MNAKYAPKPNLNPNEADLSRQVVPNPLYGVRDPMIPAKLVLAQLALMQMGGGEPTTRRLHIFPLCLYAERYTLDAVPKTNPIFSRPNMRYQYQKRGNGGQKVSQKNETNPIVDNFPCPL
jgi:hypothetical protein